MHTDPVIPIFVASIFAILVISLIMKSLKQPHVVAYLVVGIILGPSGLGLIQDQATLSRMGAFGVIFLLFFVGLEVSPKRLAANWVISVFGTIFQILVSILAVYLLGYFLGWTAQRIILLGFVISLSSTAVVLKLLEEWKELETRVGQDVLGILLVQDIIIVPMLITIGFLGGNKPSLHMLTLQVIGGIAVFAMTAWLVIKDEIRLPWLKYFGSDHEIQVFLALGMCFGMAMLTGLMELSAALGAFLAGMIISSARETHWVQSSLLSIRTIFIAVFFVSIGMLIDLNLLMTYWWQIGFMVFAAFVSNTLINAAILKALGESWGVSFYGGSLLSQIGEFSFVISSVGLQMQMINLTTYQMTIAIIALTLGLSPIWIATMKSVTDMANTKLKRL